MCLFTQADPIGIAGGINLYGYANGDPINYSDPFGLLATCPDEGGDGGAFCTAGNFAAGFGDAITFGGTRAIRDWIEAGDQVDESSGSYFAGEVGGFVSSVALGSATAKGISSGATLATSGPARGVARAAVGTRVGQGLFGGGGALNTGRAFRVGVGIKGDSYVFRLAGETVEAAAGTRHIDLVNLGQRMDFLRYIGR